MQLHHERAECRGGAFWPGTDGVAVRHACFDGVHINSSGAGGGRDCFAVGAAGGAVYSSSPSPVLHANGSSVQYRRHSPRLNAASGRALEDALVSGGDAAGLFKSIGISTLKGGGNRYHYDDLASTSEPVVVPPESAGAAEVDWSVGGGRAETAEEVLARVVTLEDLVTQSVDMADRYREKLQETVADSLHAYDMVESQSSTIQYLQGLLADNNIPFES